MKGIAYRPLADMHTDGVYFEETDRIPVDLTPIPEICEYSGLPAPSSYATPLEEEQLPLGHA